MVRRWKHSGLNIADHRHRGDILQTHIAEDTLVEGRQSCESRLAWENRVVAASTSCVLLLSLSQSMWGLNRW